MLQKINKQAHFFLTECLILFIEEIGQFVSRISLSLAILFIFQLGSIPSSLSHEIPTADISEETGLTTESIKPSHRLLLAIFEGNAEELRKLIEGGEVDLEQKDTFGLSMLHLASGQSNPEIVQLLIDEELSVNAQCGLRNSTPAHSAVRFEQLECLKVLVQNGADLTLKDSDGRTPRDLAVELKQQEIIEYLDSLSSD